MHEQINLRVAIGTNTFDAVCVELNDRLKYLFDAWLRAVAPNDTNLTATLNRRAGDIAVAADTLGDVAKEMDQTAQEPKPST